MPNKSDKALLVFFTSDLNLNGSITAASHLNSYTGMDVAKSCPSDEYMLPRLAGTCLSCITFSLAVTIKSGPSEKEMKYNLKSIINATTPVKITSQAIFRMLDSYLSVIIWFLYCYGRFGQGNKSKFFGTHLNRRFLFHFH